MLKEIGKWFNNKKNQRMFYLGILALIIFNYLNPSPGRAGVVAWMAFTGIALLALGIALFFTGPGAIVAIPVSVGGLFLVLLSGATQSIQNAFGGINIAYIILGVFGIMFLVRSRRRY